MMEREKHTFFNLPLPKGWLIKRVDQIKAPERYSCVAGPFGSSISAKYFTESGIPVIRGCNLSGNPQRFIPDGFVFVSEDKARSFPGQHVKAGDLVFTCWGTLGQVGLIPKGGPFPEYIISNKQLKLRPDLKQCDRDYLYYYFTLPQMVRHINDIAIGAAVPGINLGLLKKLKVVVPPLPTQRKIAAILTAYDDLIETNQRRIALLETMAEEIYREWFVRMRFPGHQNTKFTKGMPEDWPLQRVAELVEMNPRESVHKSDSVPYVGMDNLSESSMHFVSNESRTGAAGSKFRNRDTLLPRITPCLENGKRGFVTCLKEDQVGIGSTEFIVFREKVLPPEYIYLLSCHSSFRQHAELSMTGASGRQRVQHDCFHYFYVPTPPKVILDHFTGIVRPLFDSISLYAIENATLTRTRDLLLPRLISGKLSVEDLDIQFPPSMRDESETNDRMDSVDD